MSQPTTYEQLIAQKLQELAVPDQADAIWATIEHQLNIEMPANGPGSGGAGNPGWWIGGGSLFTLFIATVTYIITSRQHPETERHVIDKPAVIQHEQPVIKEDTSRNVILPMEPRKNKPADVPVPAEPKKEEAEQAVVEEKLQSPPVQKLTEDVPAPLPPADTLVTKKKSRGLKGISDADYRIVPSSKNKGKTKEQ